MKEIILVKGSCILWLSKLIDLHLLNACSILLMLKIILCLGAWYPDQQFLKKILALESESGVIIIKILSFFYEFIISNICFKSSTCSIKLFKMIISAFIFLIAFRFL